METMKAIARRKSIRAYKSEQISEESLNKILTAGSAAPVAMGNYESMHLTVVQDPEVLKQLSAAGAQMMKRDIDVLYGAPTLVLISSTEPAYPGVELTNAGCIAENIQLAAADDGIGSVIIYSMGMAAAANPELNQLLALPEGYKTTFGIALGYPAADDQTEKDMQMKLSMNRI